MKAMLIVSLEVEEMKKVGNYLLSLSCEEKRVGEIVRRMGNEFCEANNLITVKKEIENVRQDNQV